MDCSNRINLGCLKLWIPLLFIVGLFSVGTEPFVAYGLQKLRSNLSESGVSVEYGILRATPFSITLGSVIITKPAAGVTEVVDDLVLTPEWTSLLRLAPSVRIHARYLEGIVDGVAQFSLTGQIRHAAFTMAELHLTNSGTINALHLEDGLVTGAVTLMDPQRCTGAQSCLQAHVDITRLRKSSETSLPLQGSPLSALAGQRLISAIPLPRLQEGSLLLDIESQPTTTTIQGLDLKLDTFRLVLQGSIAAPIWRRRADPGVIPAANLTGTLRADSSVTDLLGQWGGLLGIHGKPQPDVENPLSVTGQLNRPHVAFSPAP